jgi:hypothetical protein
VQIAWAIKADPNGYISALEQIDPGIVNQGSVGLNSVMDREVLWSLPLNDLYRLRVVGWLERQGLAGMPDNIKLVLEQGAIENQSCNFRNGREGHRLAGISAIRQVTIGAIDVAKSCRLHDYQTKGTSRQHWSLV